MKHLGYYVAGWDLPNDMRRADAISQQYNVPGRMASVAADHRDPARHGCRWWSAPPAPLDYGWHDVDAQKSSSSDAFTGMRWHVPQLLDGLCDAPELYFDSISRVRVPTWPPAASRCSATPPGA